MVKVNIIFILIFLFFSNLYSQSKTETEDVFKMHLFLDKKNISRSDLNNKMIKNDSLYNSFRKNTLLKIETLKLQSHINLPVDGDFIFYVLRDVEYKNTLNPDDKWFLKVDLSLDSKYIITINQSTGRSYRLAGFNGNDFITFFSDLSEAYKSYNFKKLTISIFLKKYFVENLDFKCIHNGLKMDVIDKKEFPCLKTCSDKYSIH